MGRERDTNSVHSILNPAGRNDKNHPGTSVPVWLKSHFPVFGPCMWLQTEVWDSKRKNFSCIYKPKLPFKKRFML